MYKTILVPLDGSATSEMALPIASALARSLAARLVLTEAVRDGGRNGPGAAASDTRGVDEAAAYLTSLAARLTDEGLEVATATPYGSAAHGILDEIDTQGADLVVMTTHGRSGFSRLRHGDAILGVPGSLVKAANLGGHTIGDRQTGRVVLGTVNTQT